MNKPDKINNAIQRIWRNHSIWPTTMSRCANHADGCENGARAGMPCGDCCEKELAALVGPEKAREMREAIANVTRMEGELIHGKEN